jgi:ubiquinone/menaquinone biosynthesis C-methylase UbiE
LVDVEMSKKSGNGHFGDVDRAVSPEKFVGYLDTVTEVEAVQSYKQRSYDLLHLRPGCHVLDVGCGTGDDVRAMALKVGPSGRAVGIDNSQVMIGEAKKRSADLKLPVEFYTGLATELPFDENVFHATRCERVFQHLADPERALREMVRVTSLGGRVGVIDPDWETVVIDSPDEHLTRQILAAHRDTTRNPWSGRQLFSLFNKAHLLNIEVLPVTIPLLTFSLAEPVLEFRNSVDRAIENHTITMEEGSRWLRRLEERDDAGEFFSSITGFGVFGTKP